MADWIRPKSQRYDGEFQTIPKEASSRWGSNTASKNISDSNRGPHINGDDKEMANHRFAVRHNISHLKGMAGNGDMQRERLDHTQEHGSKFSPRNSIFQNKQSTASMCIRLKEKEEYQKLLQLQSQRSPWQRPVTIGVPGGQSLSSTDGDVITISSNSSTCEQSIGASGTSMREHQTTRSLIHSGTISTAAASVRPQVRSFEAVRPGSLSALLYEQRSRSGIGTYQRASGVGADGHKSSENKKGVTQTKTTTDENQGAPIVIDDDEDSQNPTSLKAAPGSDREESGKVSKTQRTDQSIPASFLRSRFMNDHDIEEQRKARMEEQERRKRQIAEEEQKAKAYAEKRRAQEISLEKKLKYQMRIFDEEPEVSEEIFREDEEEEEEILPILTSDMKAKIKEAMRPGNPNDVLSEGFRLQITRRDMATLSGLNWLNDEIINFYMNMLMERGEQDGRSKVYAFNTFFYPKIMSGGHSAVKRWTKKVDIFAMHYILIPVHLGMHWCLCVADMKDKVITYYDSMGASNNACLQAVLNYIDDESKVKKDAPINRKEWRLVNAKDNPHQMNGGDCGMFMCKYAEYITRGREITFTQEDMPYFRHRMVYEILTKKLLQ